MTSAQILQFQPMLRVLFGLQPLTAPAYPLRVRRLGDLMNAPPEPYSVLPSRLREGKGEIEIASLAFRYADNVHPCPGH